MTELSTTVNRRINAPAQKVFDAWLDPKMLARFMIPDAGGRVPKAEADAKVGGRFHIVMTSGDKEIPHEGAYKTIKPHTQIVFSWESPFSVDGSMVTLNFKPVGANATDLELVHEKFATEQSRDGHTGGWTAILAKLAETFA
jgi:uncharacterized protein YndB with AHSA1/START domain